MTEQQHFLDAVASDPEMTDAQKAEWLLIAAKDYWGRAEAMQEAHARIVARCMEWTDHLRIRPGGLCTTVDVVRFAEELRGIAGRGVERGTRGGAG